MSKVMELNNQSGEHGGWMIHCTACKCGHLFDNRWTFNGDMEKPTFRASMLVNGSGTIKNSIRCHSFVTDGKIEYLSDCGHKYAGKTLKLEDIK